MASVVFAVRPRSRSLTGTSSTFACALVLRAARSGLAGGFGSFRRGSSARAACGGFVLLGAFGFFAWAADCFGAAGARFAAAFGAAGAAAAGSTFTAGAAGAGGSSSSSYITSDSLLLQPAVRNSPWLLPGSMGSNRVSASQTAQGPGVLPPLLAPWKPTEMQKTMPASAVLSDFSARFSWGSLNSRPMTKPRLFARPATSSGALLCTSPFAAR